MKGRAKLACLVCMITGVAFTAMTSNAAQFITSYGTMNAGVDDANQAGPMYGQSLTITEGVDSGPVPATVQLQEVSFQAHPSGIGSGVTAAYLHVYDSFTIDTTDGSPTEGDVIGIGNLVAVSSSIVDLTAVGSSGVATWTFANDSIDSTAEYAYVWADDTIAATTVDYSNLIGELGLSSWSLNTGNPYSGGTAFIANSFASLSPDWDLEFEVKTTDGGGVPPVISSFAASETSVFSSETVTLSWGTVGEDALTLLPGIGDVTGLTSTNVVITANVTYSLIASNAIGNVTNTVDITLRGAELAKVFADHMVLQRGETVPVFGSDLPGQAITVTFAGQTKVTTADTNGNWRVDLDPMVASMTGRPLTVTGSVVATITDVLVGEVWLAAGQSNMRWMVSQSSTSPYPANYSRIRMCSWVQTVGTGGGTVYGPTELANLTPENFYTGTWQVLNATTVQAQSGVAYFYANALARELAGTGPGGIDVPVGVVELAIGGTSTEAFISTDTLQADPYLKALFEDPRGVRTLGQWTAGRITTNLGGYEHSDPSLPHPHPYAPGFLYWAGMENIVPFAFKGAIWYQGESNAEFTDLDYRWNGDRISDFQTDVMTALVDSWRTAFAKPDFPVYMVQLPRISGSTRTQWPWYREAQSRVTANLNGVEMAIVTEFGDNGSNVHPTNKEPVGERLAYIARNKHYGENIAYSGPVYASQEIVGNKIILHFDHVEDGLISSDAAALRHFEISGEDRTFVAATATIVGDTVEVSAPSVANPVAVRYGWDMNIDVNFYNTNSVENLPASPFRTDDWVVAPGRKIRVACIGDSITQGFGHTDPASYPSQLQTILGTANFEVQNFGKSGSGVHRASNKYDNSAEYTAALAFNPDIVICNLGINDITDWGAFTQDQFIGEYRDLVDAFAGLSTAPLFIHWHELSPLFPGQAFYGSPNLPILNDWIGDSADVTGARTVDMYEFFKDHPEWYPDNIHPNAEGYRNIAEETFRFLATLDPLHGDPVITEFMADNITTLQDEDSDYSDWVEITNEGITGMVIGGHHLSGTDGSPMQWQLPAELILEPNEAAVIFASGKDRAVFTNELHSSFTLNENGGYLGLADSTGLVLQAFAPLYPAQFADISYGLGAGSVASLVDTSSVLRAEVPVDGTDALAWTAPIFNDADWPAGLVGVGYEELAPVPGSKLSSAFPVLLNGDDIWDSGFKNGWSESDASVAKSLDGTVLTYDHSGSGVDAFLLETSSWNTGNNGDWTFETRLRFTANPSGFILWLGTDTQRILVEIHGDRVQDLGGETFNVARNNLDGEFHNYRVAHDVSAGKYRVWRDGEDLTPPGGVAYDVAAADNRLILGDYTNGSFGDNFNADIAYVRYDQTGIFPPPAYPIYTDLIALDMAGDMTNQNAGCYVRVPFTLSEALPAGSTLFMDVQYDDGYVAYLNGTLVASNNAPATPAWNSAAASDRSDYAALAPELLDLSAYADQLVVGSNVLAIHALNSAPDAERFLISAGLTATTPTVEGFQETATPGAGNGAITSTSQAWLDTHFSPAEQALPAVSGDEADPDGDTIINLLEYIFGMDPRVADGINPLWMRVEPYTIELQPEVLLTATFPVRLGLDDATFALECTNDLVTDGWNPEPLVVLESDTVNNGDGTHTVTYRDIDASVTNDVRFIRFSAERL